MFSKEMNILIALSSIAVIYILCRISPIIVAIPIGIGARIFKYQVLPGSLSHRWIFIFAGIVGAFSADLIYRAFGVSLPWWPFAGSFLTFAVMCSNKKLDVNGMAATAGSASGCLIYLLIRWLA
jgi:uncharacterized membrane protein YeaQ/YmgE (transglycosylase-associated protein family)